MNITMITDYEKSTEISQTNICIEETTKACSPCQK